MALHDYRCPDCGYIQRDFHVPTGIRASEMAPRCPKHQFPLGGTRMEWIPQAKFSCFSDSGKQSGDSFTKFTTPVEDPGSPTGFRDETIGSLADIRRLERESEIRERNGEGRRMIWRDYSQDPSNRDKHTIAEDPSLTPSKTFANGTPVTIRRGDSVVADHGEQHHGPRGGPDHTLGGAGL
jgi:hypothetical protein